MNSQIIEELRKITEEEQVLLSGDGVIDRKLYQTEELSDAGATG